MSFDEVTYHGWPGGRRVTVETSAGELWPLCHVARHSPTGLGWGYAGSGPADLARSLLLDALGPDAACPTCQRTRELAVPLQDEDGVGAVPYDPLKHAEQGDWQVERCWDCEDGYRTLPYQDYKAEVIARLPLDGEWRLSRREVREWLHARTRLAAIPPANQHDA